MTNFELGKRYEINLICRAKLHLGQYFFAELEDEHGRKYQWRSGTESLTFTMLSKRKFRKIRFTYDGQFKGVHDIMRLKIMDIN